MSNDKADIVYLYPKTSCPCENCQREFQKPTGNKTNLSVKGCKISPFFDCYNRAELGGSIQPRQREGITYLNPQVQADNESPYFQKVECVDNKMCPVVYASGDPRLRLAGAEQRINLDRPPTTGDVKLSEIYSDEIDNYGVGFKPYNEINDGDIIYYVDESRADAFYEPLFAEKAQEVTVLFKDPMGAMKPEYHRIPLVNTACPTVTTAESYPDCLSFIQDSQSHREDLMALQMQRRNQERWMPRWDDESTN